MRRFCTAPVLDAQLDSEPLWVVTEYVAGPDLGRMLRENGPLTDSNVEALAVGVATALTAIHGAGLVHRDLKPANVLLSPLGPRVIDFGITRALDAGDRQTATDQVFGTPDYMAPETPPRGEVVYHETFAADNSGWNNEGTRVGTGQGYTGDGRYTIKMKRGAGYRWGTAPVKTGLPDRALASVKMNFSGAGAGGRRQGERSDPRRVRAW